MRSHTPVAALIVLSIACLASADTAPEPATYRALVDSYRAHGPDEIAAVLNMSPDAVDAAVGRALSKSEGWAWDELRAAAMLHSEVCLAAIQESKPMLCGLHINQAQRLLDEMVRRSAPQEDFSWRWHTIVPRMLRYLGLKTTAEELDAKVRRTWGPDVARADYLRGLVYELKAVREGITSTAVGPAMLARAGSQGSFLAPAAALFEKALKEKPELAIASLHLGRVRTLQDERTAAATSLRAALGAADPSVRYMASLFLGSLEERDQHFDAAERLYRDAIRLVPYGQAASLALSELLSRTGRDGEARQVLAERLLHVKANILDPFWVYAVGPDEALAPRFDLLRMEVWK
jgi:tetratricopeptide (TPR) repeat protein